MERRPDRLLRIAEVTSQVGMSTSTIYKLMRAGKFPQLVEIEGMARWSYREIQAFIQAKKASREQAQEA